MHFASPNVTRCSVLHMRFYSISRVSSCVGCAKTCCFPNIGFRDNKKLKQGHFEMGIRYANFMPISNHFARKRASLCPLTKCYLATRLCIAIIRSDYANYAHAYDLCHSFLEDDKMLIFLNKTECDLS